MHRAHRDLRTYSTCPSSKDVGPSDYARHVSEVARWSEQAGCHGILVYTDNGVLDPWLVAQHVLRSTEHLRPLVAVQPLYLHPYAVAKAITSLAYLHDRAVDVNWLAGGFVNDLTALGDDTPHDLRYERTRRYADIVMGLLRGERVTAHDRWHDVAGLALKPALPSHLLPGQLISGSSPAGARTAVALGATPVRYPKRWDEEAVDPTAPAAGSGLGIRVGLLARQTSEAAWATAHARFPEDRRGRLEHDLAVKVSDSHWHRQLSSSQELGAGDDPYWLGAFNTSRSVCPYLVGSYDRVAAEVGRYLDLGVDTVLLDIPPDAEELAHAGEVLHRALAAA